MTCWLTDLSIHWFIDSLIHCFIVSLIHWYIDLLINWIFGLFISWLIDWLIYGLIDLLIGFLYIYSFIHLSSSMVPSSTCNVLHWCEWGSIERLCETYRVMVTAQSRLCNGCLKEGLVELGWSWCFCLSLHFACSRIFSRVLFSCVCEKVGYGKGRRQLVVAMQELEMSEILPATEVIHFGETFESFLLLLKSNCLMCVFGIWISKACYGT